MIAPPDGLIGRPNRYGNAHRRQGSRSKTQAAGSAAIDMVADHWAVVRPALHRLQARRQGLFLHLHDFGLFVHVRPSALSILILRTNSTCITSIPDSTANIPFN